MKQIAIVIPPGIEVVVLRPGQATMGSRFHAAIIVQGALWSESAVEQKRLDDWYDSSFLTSLAMGVGITAVPMGGPLQPAEARAATEWRWVDEQGRAMTKWVAGDPPPMNSVSDEKGTMRVEIRTVPQLTDQRPRCCEKAVQVWAVCPDCERFNTEIRESFATPPPPSDADDLAGQIADIAWDFLVAAGYTDEDFDAVPLTVIRDNLSQRKGEKAPPSDAAQGVHVRHIGGGLLALYRGDEQVREIGVTPGWNFRDRDEFIARYNAHKGEGNV